MNSTGKKVASAVLVTLVGIGLTTASAAHAAAKSKSSEVEKCYGIVKKGKNDCGTTRHACAGQSKVNGSPSEWMFVMKGNCDRIVGGSLKPENGPKKKK